MNDNRPGEELRPDREITQDDVDRFVELWHQATKDAAAWSVPILLEKLPVPNPARNEPDEL